MHAHTGHVYTYPCAHGYLLAFAEHREEGVGGPRRPHVALWLLFEAGFIP